MTKTPQLTLLAGVWCITNLLSPTANAASVVDNLSNPISDGIVLSTAGASFAQAIQNDPIELQLGQVILKLGSQSGTATARVKLWSSVGTSPEVLVEDLGVISNINSSVPNDFAISSTTQPELNEATRYWITVTNENGAGELVWARTLDSSSQGLATISDLQAESADGAAWVEADNTSDHRMLLRIQPFLDPFTVANNQDDGPGSLRWTVENANTVPGHQDITFAPSLAGATITLQTGELLINSSLAIDASNLPQRVTVSGNANANGSPDPGESRIFDLTSAANVTLRHLILRDGQVTNSDTTVGPISWGGGIRSAGSLTMTDCDVLNCRARFGGGIYSTGTLHLTRVRVLGNFAQAKAGDEENPNENVIANGGGIYSEGSATLHQCRLDNNKATYGGGFWNGPGATANFSQGSVSNNEALLGGGIWNETGAEFHFSKTSIVQNTATISGGGIYNDQGEVQLNQCTLAANTATSFGGAIYCDASSVLGLVHCTIAWNHAGTNGGGIFNNIGSTMTMEMSLAARNQRSPAINNDVVGSWTAPAGTVNLVVAQGPGTVTGPTPLTSDPILSQPGEHGAIGKTVALLAGSPAINAATGSTITSDQRSQPVIGTPDLGAFETQTGIDDHHGTIAFLENPFSILEEVGTGMVPLTRTGGALGTVTVTVNSTFDTATEEDFNPVVNHVVTFTHGQTLAYVPVTVISDPDLLEPNENFLLTLTSPTGGAALGSPNPAVIRIIDFVDRVNPRLTVLTPVNNLLILEPDGPVIQVTGTASDNMGIERVNISLDGLPFQPANLTHEPDFLSCTFELPLNVAPGRHNVLVQAVDTRGRVSTSIRRFFNYRVIRDLAVHVNGPGRISSGFVPASPARFVGIPYTISAVANPGAVFDGWTANEFTGTGVTPAASELSRLTFIMQEGLELTANFIPNPFIPDITGRFNGLVLADTGTTPASTNTGVFTATLTNRGGFSARLTLDGLTHALTGVFTNQGAVRFGRLRLPVQTITRRNKPTLEVELELDLNPTNPVISGTVTQRDPGNNIVAVSQIEAKRARYSNAQKVDPALAGTSLQRYNLILPAKSQSPPKTAHLYPQGVGIGSLIVRANGTVNFSIHAADNTRFTFSTALSKDNDCPLFAQLYRKLGCFAGLVVVDPDQAETDAAAVNCRWFRPLITTSQWYPQGWPLGLDIDLFASKYLIPVGASVLPGLGADDFVNGNAELGFSGGLLSPPDLNKALNITAANAITNAPAADKSFSARLTRGTGEWRGTFTHTDGRKPAWQATTFQKAGPHQGAWGFFMSAAPRPANGLGESGKVSLKPF